MKGSGQLHLTGEGLRATAHLCRTDRLSPLSTDASGAAVFVAEKGTYLTRSLRRTITARNNRLRVKDTQIQAHFCAWTTGLLSRGSQVRVLSGAPFPKEFAHFDRDEISRRTQIEKSDRSCECAPHFAHSISRAFLRVCRSSITRGSSVGYSDHRPRMPEVALRRRHSMAWCCRRESIARTPSIDRAEPGGVCVAAPSAARDAAYVG